LEFEIILEFEMIETLDAKIRILFGHLNFFEPGKPLLMRFDMVKRRSLQVLAFFELELFKLLGTASGTTLRFPKL
jgi:hypothetical protein